MNTEKDLILFDNPQFNITSLFNVIHYSRGQNIHDTYPPVLPTHELMYYDAGETTVRFGKHTVNMAEGSILYLPKGIKNDVYSLYSHTKFSFYNIYFDTNSNTPDTPVVFNPSNDDFLRLFRKVFTTWINKHFGYYYKSMGITYEIIELLHHCCTTYMPNNKLRLLMPSEYYIAEHYCNTNFNYKKLTELSGMSYSWFKKLFIEKHGCSPVKYVTRLKINRACELLKTQKFKISEVAELCGFENVYYFSNVFKKHMGVSPKNYNQ